MTTAQTVPTNKAHRHDLVAEVPAVTEEPAGAKWTAAAAQTLTGSSEASTNPALLALQTGGGLLFIGGLIAMITGMNRTAPRGSYLASAAETITSAMQFAGTSTLIVTAGGVALMLGGMCLVGALIVAAVKAAKVTE